MSKVLCEVCGITDDETHLTTSKFRGRHRSRNPADSTPACEWARYCEARYQAKRKGIRRGKNGQRKPSNFPRPEDVDEFVLGFTVGKSGLIPIECLTREEVMAGRSSELPPRSGRRGLVSTVRSRHT